MSAQEVQCFKSYYIKQVSVGNADFFKGFLIKIHSHIINTMTGQLKLVKQLFTRPTFAMN